MNIILDKGTTAIACLNTKRNFIGIEKDDKYFKVATDRVTAWENTPTDLFNNKIK